MHNKVLLVYEIESHIWWCLRFIIFSAFTFVENEWEMFAHLISLFEEEQRAADLLKEEYF